MKILSDKEFKEIKETIEMYNEEYNQALEDYYKLNKEFKNLKELLVKFQSKNQKLRNKLEDKDKILNKAIEYIENDMPYLEEPDEEFERCDGTTYMTMKEYDTSILLNILKGEENES